MNSHLIITTNNPHNRHMHSETFAEFEHSTFLDQFKKSKYDSLSAGIDRYEEIYAQKAQFYAQEKASLRVFNKPDDFPNYIPEEIELKVMLGELCNQLNVVYENRQSTRDMLKTFHDYVNKYHELTRQLKCAYAKIELEHKRIKKFRQCILNHLVVYQEEIAFINESIENVYLSTFGGSYGDMLWAPISYMLTYKTSLGELKSKLRKIYDQHMAKLELLYSQNYENFDLHNEKLTKKIAQLDRLVQNVNPFERLMSTLQRYSPQSLLVGVNLIEEIANVQDLCQAIITLIDY